MGRQRRASPISDLHVTVVNESVLNKRRIVARLAIAICAVSDSGATNIQSDLVVPEVEVAIHAVFLDGGYVNGPDGEPVFQALEHLRGREVAEVLVRARKP